jgi:uncharacterized protein (TIGR02145 family)
MKQQILLFLTFLIIYGCSSSTDENTTAIPNTPTNLIGVAISTTQINLSWTDNSTNETGFKIERKIGSGTYAVVGTTGIDINTFSDIGLMPNTTYTYRVYSYNTVGNSTPYSNELTISPSITDLDGNTYQLVTICNQTWTKTNLNVSKYRNGDIIPQITDATQWRNITTGAWCYYANTSSYGTTYGKLYNWYAVNDPRGLAPLGYHIPTDSEWTSMINCLDPNSNGGATAPNIAGSKMKEIGTTHWNGSNADANNSSGFTGLPGGYRNNDGAFNPIGIQGYWWSSSESNITIGINTFAWSRNLNYNFGSVIKNNFATTCGFSVRCIKD